MGSGGAAREGQQEHTGNGDNDEAAEREGGEGARVSAMAPNQIQEQWSFHVGRNERGPKEPSAEWAGAKWVLGRGRPTQRAGKRR